MKITLTVEAPNVTLGAQLLKVAGRRLDFNGGKSFDLRNPDNGAVIGHVEVEDEVPDEPEKEEQ